MSEQEMETGGEPTPQVESTIPQEQEIVEPTPQIKEVPKELTKQERITNALGDIPKEPNEQLIEAIDETLQVSS